MKTKDFWDMPVTLHGQFPTFLILPFHHHRCKFLTYCIKLQCYYRVIKNSLCTWWLQNRKLRVMFKVSPTSLQTFIDTPNCVLKDRVQYSTVHISNVFCDGHLQLINCVRIVLYYTVIVRCTKTFWSPCISWSIMN